jgi:predicted butyrate kinase (DUF1464 family)
VAGTDPGTSSLDVVVLSDGAVEAQTRFLPEQLQTDPTAPVRWLEAQGPFALVAGPSGYGLPLVRAADCTPRDRALMSLVRPDHRAPMCTQASERGRAGGVTGFSAVVEAFCASALPVVFLPGVIHLPTVPPHRKLNRIDLGTPDKLAVAALALAVDAEAGAWESYNAAILELGSVFSACVVMRQGRVVDGLGGTSGPIGWGSGGAWDGELAYLLWPLSKGDLFQGGVESIPEREWALALFREALVRLAASLAFFDCMDVVLSGRLLERESWLVEALSSDLGEDVRVRRLVNLPGAWVKQSAQGAAVLADGLAGGRWAEVVERLQIRGAAGSVLDWIRHPRAGEVRAAFGFEEASGG